MKKRKQELFVGIGFTKDAIPAEQTLVVSAPAPETEILLQDHPDGKVLAFKFPDGRIRQRRTAAKALYVIPTWCANSPDDHACAWGCMGISEDLVSKQGRSYCTGCECYTPQKGEKEIVQYPLHNSEDYDGWRMAQGGEWEDAFNVGPVSFPCMAVCFKVQGRNEWGRRVFIQHAHFVYPDEMKSPEKKAG